MAQGVKFLLYKQKDPSLDLQHPQRSECDLEPVIPVEGRDKQIPLASKSREQVQ